MEFYYVFMKLCEFGEYDMAGCLRTMEGEGRAMIVM